MRSRFTWMSTLRTFLGPAAFALAACTRFGAVYPPRPPETTGAPVADPSPSRVTAHVALGASALREALDVGVPRTGDGAFTALRSERK